MIEQAPIVDAQQVTDMTPDAHLARGIDVPQGAELEQQADSRIPEQAKRGIIGRIRERGQQKRAAEMAAAEDFLAKDPGAAEEADLITFPYKVDNQKRETELRRLRGQRTHQGLPDKDMARNRGIDQGIVQLKIAHGMEQERINKARLGVYRRISQGGARMTDQERQKLTARNADYARPRVRTLPIAPDVGRPGTRGR